LARDLVVSEEFAVPMYKVCNIAELMTSAVYMSAYFVVELEDTELEVEGANVELEGSPTIRMTLSVTVLSPAATASANITHITLTIPATEAESAPPDKGNRKPDAPDTRR